MTNNHLEAFNVVFVHVHLSYSFKKKKKKKLKGTRQIFILAKMSISSYLVVARVHATFYPTFGFFSPSVIVSAYTVDVVYTWKYGGPHILNSIRVNEIKLCVQRLCLIGLMMGYGSSVD